MTAADHIAVALDHASVDDNLDLIRRLKGRAKWLKSACASSSQPLNAP